MDKDKDKLGKGGNGKVSKHYINHRMFAVKAVSPLICILTMHMHGVCVCACVHACMRCVCVCVCVVRACMHIMCAFACVHVQPIQRRSLYLCIIVMSTDPFPK